MEAWVNPLIAWHKEHRIAMPWRENQDAYRVWISEIMLQQTRIEAVIPYYERFITELPDVSALATVEDEKLMKLWEGLGYYSRARNLKKAAVAIMAQYGGELPRTAKELRKLPGIGPATAQNYMDYLQQGGGFFFPEDLKNVKGIGDKKAIDLLPYFHFTLPTLPPPSPLFP